jgi:hypothetical protein
LKEFTRKTILFLSIITCVWACTLEEEIYTRDPSAKLIFSENAVVFDTIYTALPSITRWLTVYNPNRRAITIDNVYLGNPADSPYEVIVNGRPLANARNLRLLGGDSLLILVKAAINPRNENLPFIVYDSLMFHTNGNLQNVKLLAWGQDVSFVRYKDFLSVCNSTWTAGKPYVLMDSLRVVSGCKLTLEAGTQVYSRPGAKILVEGSLDIKGTADKRVILADFRQLKDNAPGQWGGLVFRESSRDSYIRGVEIRNATIGLDVQISDEDALPDVTIENTLIKNMLQSGINAIDADIALINTLITNCVSTLINVRGGGNYTCRHCTFANYSFDFGRELPAVLLSNAYRDVTQGVQFVRPLSWVMQNSIIWGGSNFTDELRLDRNPAALFTIEASHSLIRTRLPEMFTGNNNLLNVPPRPLFVDPSILNFRPDSLSPLINAGMPLGTLEDITGKKRGDKPDIGAYER